jgi:hypothetical protein
VLQDQLADEKRKVEELEARGVEPADDDELGQELATSQEEIKNLNKVGPPCFRSLTTENHGPPVSNGETTIHSRAS